MKTIYKTEILLLVAMILSACSLGQQIAVSVMNKQDLTRYEIREDKIILNGELNSRTPEKIRAILLENPKIRTLVLAQMPGSLDDEALFPFARWLRAEGYNTHLESTSEIASGAVDLFLSGNARTMEKGARLGVHSWSDGDKEAKEYPPTHSAHSLNANYINAMLGADKFYWFTINAAPAEEIHWMNDAEIRQFKILTEPIIQN